MIRYKCKRLWEWMTRLTASRTGTMHAPSYCSRMLAVLAGIVMVLIPVPLLAEKDGDDHDKALIRMQKIIDSELTRQCGKKGFEKRPEEINFEEDPEYKKTVERFGTIWKEIEVIVADGYQARQQSVNNRLRPEAKKYRKPLVVAFQTACELRGGGSASGHLYVCSKTEAEWCIGHLDTPTEVAVSDGRFKRELGWHIDKRPDEVVPVLESIHEVEKHLTKTQANFVRGELLAYFRKYSYRNEK